MRTKLAFAALCIFLAASVGWSQTAGFVRHNLQVYDELGRRVTDITAVQINTGASAQTIYQDRYLNTEIANPMGTASSNTTLSNGSCYWYGADAFSVSVTSTAYGTATFAGYNASYSRVILPTWWAIGMQSAAVTVTATTDGLTTGLIPSGSRFVSVTSDTITKVVVLPAAVIGNIITITVPATGCELQTLATTNETINTVDCDGTNELALVAGSVYTLTCTKAITWVAQGVSSAGAAEATLTPDAD